MLQCAIFSQSERKFSSGKSLIFKEKLKTPTKTGLLPINNDCFECKNASKPIPTLEKSL
jgi:hypothetical protein